MTDDDRIVLAELERDEARLRVDEAEYKAWYKAWCTLPEFGSPSPEALEAGRMMRAMAGRFPLRQEVLRARRMEYEQRPSVVEARNSAARWRAERLEFWQRYEERFIELDRKRAQRPEVPPIEYVDGFDARPHMRRMGGR